MCVLVVGHSGVNYVSGIRSLLYMEIQSTRTFTRNYVLRKLPAFGRANQRLTSRPLLLLRHLRSRSLITDIARRRK